MMSDFNIHMDTMENASQKFHELHTNFELYPYIYRIEFSCRKANVYYIYTINSHKVVKWGHPLYGYIVGHIVKSVCKHVSIGDSRLIISLVMMFENCSAITAYAGRPTNHAAQWRLSTGPVANQMCVYPTGSPQIKSWYNMFKE